MSDEGQTEPVGTKDAKRQAKADAAADKARAKAERPFWKKKRFIIPAVFLLLLILVIATMDDDGDGATVVDEDAAAEAEDAPEQEPEEAQAPDEVDDADDLPLGTRSNPLDIGTTIEMGDWQLAVVDVTRDATDQVMAENEFNDPPADGYQFIMFEVDATYVGDDSGDPWLDFSWAIVGSEGNTFGSGGSMDHYCGVFPNPLDEQGETYTDGSVSGNVCISADSAQLEAATIRIEETFSMQDTRAFYALD
jgi:hypothetical protein